MRAVRGAESGRRALWVAPLVAAALLAGCAGPEPAPPDADPPRLDAWPRWDVGDRWSWRVTSTATNGSASTSTVAGTVVAVAEDVYHVSTTTDGDEPEEVAFWRTNVTAVGERGDALRFPLEVGASWEAGRWTVRVVGYEPVDTAAGPFDAWRLRFDGPAGSSREEWWSPEAKVWVLARQERIVQGAPVSVERELEEADLASGKRWPSTA